MTATHRPRRSMLYMPGSRDRALEKARGLPADALILDLEDAAPPAEKARARELVVAAVNAGGYGGREVIVRVNGPDTEWGADDLAAVAPAGPDAILIPKVGDAAMLADMADRMIAAGAPDRTTIWAMMETPRGVLNAAEIAEAHPRMAGMVMGTNDLVNEMNARHTPGRAPMAFALGQCLTAARAAGIACIDGVYNAFKDDAGLRAECVAGRDMGFDGKTLIHPAQLSIANEVFAPSEESLAEAREQLAAFEATVAQGGGVAVVNGRIVENLHVAAAQRLISAAEAIERLEADAS